MLAYILIYILAAVLCLAVGVMLMYHLWTIANGETSVEGQDHEVYRKVAGSRGEVRVCFELDFPYANAVSYDRHS